MSEDSKEVKKLTSDEKYAICKACENLSIKYNTCKLCGCYMPLKTKLPTMKCPAGKWQILVNCNSTCTSDFVYIVT